MYNTESTSYKSIYNIDRTNNFRKILFIILVFFILCLFLPWTQNIRTIGNVTSLRQEQRAQNVNTIIPGSIVKWYVKEGDIVKTGDTIVQLAEIKDDYLDPSLILRTQEQLDAKQQTIEYYEGKTNAQRNQLDALKNSLDIKIVQLKNKLIQAKNKIQSDSANLVSSKNDLSIANKQYNRQRELYEEGLVSLTQFEQRNQSLQSLQAKLISAENNLANSRQEYIIIQLELSGAQQEYIEKINKTQGETMQSMSQIATSAGEVSKLKNQYANYENRQKLYFVTAPQDGQIVQAKRSGLGEILKDGETIAQIIPTEIEFAVELYVMPVDVPLIALKQQITVIFDGFPAIVFRGWPAASYGTFGGEIVAIENNVSPNGMFRILVKENERPWPKQLRIGTGVQAIALLKNVPIWYELWRNLSGFPPDFYQTKNEPQSKK